MLATIDRDCAARANEESSHEYVDSHSQSIIAGSKGFIHSHYGAVYRAGFCMDKSLGFVDGETCHTRNVPRVVAGKPHAYRLEAAHGKADLCDRDTRPKKIGCNLGVL
jgi:hypothetical protein